MAGALASLYDMGKTFDHIWTTGAGGLVGLVYIAPKNGSPAEALEAMIEMSIADPIYQLFPVNYKIFKKSSPFLHAFERWGELWKVPVRSESAGAGYRRLWNDSVDFWTAALTPSDVTFQSKGLCEPLPFLEDIVDFSRVQDWPGKFFLSAYNLTDNAMEVFPKPLIDPRHVRAATAALFLYPPVRIGTKEYTEGAFHDPLNLQGLRRKADEMELDTQCIVLSDILSRRRQLLRPPQNLWEAYGQSIMAPVVTLARVQREIFEHLQSAHNTRFDLIELKFNIPKQVLPDVLDWSYSNIRRMWRIGRRAGKDFCETHGDKLPNIADLAPWPNTGSTP
jgi:predicted acylesterase/phospholipase RssA